MTPISTPQVQVDYDVAGSGETLVLVHGSWSNRNNWLPVVADLARSFRVVTYDRRDYGRSQRGAGGTRRDQEDDLAALIEHVGGGEPANLVGTSFGGSIAVGLATRRPDLVRRLAVHEPPLLALVGHDPELWPELESVGAAMGAVLARIGRGDAAGAAEEFVERIAFEPGTWEQLPEPIRATMVDSAQAVLGEQQDPMWALVEPSTLAWIACPVLVTQGDQSPAWFRAIVARLATEINGATVHTYEGAGHAPHLTHPSDYVAMTTAFAVGSRDMKEAA